MNTILPNQLVFEAIRDKQILGLDIYTSVKREVKFEDSRIDVFAENDSEKCFIEVKNASMKVDDACLFPDAETTRGLKHIETLIRIKTQGIRAIMFYVVQRSDVEFFGTAEHIDPNYHNALQRAIKQGVEVIAMQAEVSLEGVHLKKQLPLKF